MRLLKRSVSILLTLTMMLGILAVIPLQASAATGVSYIYRYWDSANKKVVDTVKTLLSKQKPKTGSNNNIGNKEGIDLTKGNQVVGENQNQNSICC